MLLGHDEYRKCLGNNLKNSYAPYSNFPVVCAIVEKNGDLTFGNNIENASFSATICAERSAIVSFLAQGKDVGEISRVYVMGKGDKPISPCLVCRQVMTEFFDDRIEIILLGASGDVKTTRISELAPYPFLREDL